jgi:GNAT superfamily N-acetyltransferase
VIEIRRTTLDDWSTWRELRLNALRLAPTAFGETYANALAGDEAYWQKWWIERGDTALRSIAYADGVPAGQIGCLQWRGPDADPELIAMWVEAAFRGTGVADALVLDVLAWAREKGYRRVALDGAEAGSGGADRFPGQQRHVQ